MKERKAMDKKTSASEPARGAVKDTTTKKLSNVQ